MQFFSGQRFVSFKSCPMVTKTLDVMTSEGLGEKFQVEFADMGINQIPLGLMGEKQTHQVCADRSGLDIPLGGGKNLPRK